MTQYAKVWLVPWEPGQIGVGFTTDTGQIGLKELRERDPEYEQIRSLSNPIDIEKLERHLQRTRRSQRHRAYVK